MKPDSLESLRLALQQFAKERDWEQFHNPKNLCCALSVEVAELLEHFLWDSEPAGESLPPERRGRVSQEIGDVLLYLVRLADKLGIDPVEAARQKLVLNAERYPIELARGSSRKYTEF
jgi:NTP pyrophosphatase (non-canonical NTP hydrolase)